MAPISSRLVAVPPPAAPHEARFNGVVLDLRAALVRRGDTVLALRPKAFDVLAYFVRHSGRLIPKLELLQAVWPGVTVTDDSLVQCLVEIRRALGDADPITTVRGRGYRLDALVEWRADDAVGEARHPPTPSVVAPDPSAPPESDVPEAGPSAHQRWPHGRLAAVGVLSIAVAIGLAWWWSVTGGRPELGRPVGLESTVPEATRLHADGRAHLETLTRVSLLQAADKFEAATRLDPTYAGAWAGLSHALIMLHIYGAAESTSALPRAREAAARAIALDPTLADAHSAMAHVTEQFDRDWSAAAASHRRATALAPQDGRLQERYALFLVSQMQTDEALAAAQRAVALQPQHVRPRVIHGITLLLAGRLTDAVAEFDRSGALEAGNSLARYWRAVALTGLGRLDEALADASAALTAAGNEPTAVVGVIHARAGRTAEAEEVWRSLESKAATTYVPPTDFAILAAALGRHDEAVRWLERGANAHARGMAGITVHPLLRPLHGHPRFIALAARLGLKLPTFEPR